MLHTLFFADEVRDSKEIGTPKAEVCDAELRFAKRLVDELRVDEFDPTKYHDAFRERLAQAAREKAKGRTLEIAEPASAKASVIDVSGCLAGELQGIGCIDQHPFLSKLGRLIPPVYRTRL